jgi:4-carboxymuconolactone decarboxylase
MSIQFSVAAALRHGKVAETNYESLDDPDVMRLVGLTNRPLQELVTEYCWGAVWGREELPKKTRSLLNLAMISALNRPHELKMHVRGALRNGVSREEIREVFLQVAIYCGVPAAVDSFRIAREAFNEADKEG